VAPIWPVVIAIYLIFTSLPPPICRGALIDTSVYTTGVGGHTDVKLVEGGGVLWLFKRDIKGKFDDVIVDRVDGISGRNALLRWQLFGNKCHYVAYGMATGDTFARTGTVRAVPLNAIETLNMGGDITRFRERQDAYEKSIRHDPYLSPVMRAVTFKGNEVARRVTFDFWPHDDGRCEVYTSEPDNGCRLTRADYHPEWKLFGVRARSGWWEARAAWALEWAGPFYVVAVRGDRFFVTDTGRVFAAPRVTEPGKPFEEMRFAEPPAPKPTAKLKEIWNGPPVDALIRDDDSGKWYAFTKEQYFEIADPVKPRPHTISIRRTWYAEQALETATKCGRVIRGLPEPKAK
jgi:hypothetical protein